MNNLMIDLETLDTVASTAVVSIGAVFFDVETGELGAEFYAVITLDDAVGNGSISRDTLIWWLKQDGRAQGVFNEHGGAQEEALSEFRTFIDEHTDECVVWGNGGDFDIAILNQKYEGNPPWKHYNSRCFRTMKAYLPKVKIDFEGVAHNALDDAKWQALYLMKALNQSGAGTSA